MLGFGALLILGSIRLGDDMAITHTDGETRWSARLLDVSAGGIGAICDRELSLGGTYDVRSPGRGPNGDCPHAGCVLRPASRLELLPDRVSVIAPGRRRR